jgi:hypothetical protein
VGQAPLSCHGFTGIVSVSREFALNAPPSHPYSQQMPIPGHNRRLYSPNADKGQKAAVP